MDKLRRLMERRWAADALALCIAVAFYMLLKNLGTITGWISSFFSLLSPVVIGLVLAYLIDPVVRFLEERPFQAITWKKKHSLAVLIAVLVVAVVLTLFVIAVVPSLMHSLSGLINNMDDYGKTIRELYEQLSVSELGQMLNLASASDLLDSMIRTVSQSLRQNVGTILNKSVSFGSALFNAVIGMILAVYFLSGKAELLRSLGELRARVLPAGTLERHNAFFRECNRIFIQYIGCNLLDGLVIGAINALFMSVMGMPYTALVSVVVGVTNLLPTFGPLIGAVIGAFVLVLNQPMNALLFLIFTAVLQTFDGYLLKPKLFSGSFGIPPVWSLISILLGGKLFGVVGILLAIPTVAAVTGIYLRWLRPEAEKIVPAERAPEKHSGEVPDPVSKKQPEDAPERIPETDRETESGTASEKAPAEAPEKPAEKHPAKLPEKSPAAGAKKRGNSRSSRKR